MTQPPRRPGGRNDQRSPRPGRSQGPSRSARPPGAGRTDAPDRPRRRDRRDADRDAPRDFVPGSAADPVVAGLGPESGDLIDTTIERIVPGGDGIAHGGGLTIFVPLTVPGDRVRVSLDRRRGKVAWGTSVDLLEPGPERAEPPCPYFGVCGGCDFQQLTYDAQLAAKREIIRDCLSRIGRIDPPEDLEIIPSPRPLTYRLVAEWAIDSRARRFGYRQRGSHDVIDVEYCPILDPQLNGVLADQRERLDLGLFPPNIPELRAVGGDDGAGVGPPVSSDYPAHLEREIAGERYVYDASCFFQANGLLLDTLVAEALWQATPDATAPAPLSGDGPGFAIDLYAGMGLFSVPLARRFRRVVSVEGFPPAAKWARRNLQDAGLGHAKVDVDKVETWLARRARALTGAAIVVLDPPRIGISPEAADGILALAPDRITYVSCDPATQARDLKVLIAGGYRLERIVGLDMFPQNHHVEVVAHLVRNH